MTDSRKKPIYLKRNVIKKTVIKINEKYELFIQRLTRDFNARVTKLNLANLDGLGFGTVTRF